MITADLKSLKLLECWFGNTPNMRMKSGFPLYKSTGTKELSVVYFEIEPGNSLGTHTDSSEEIILVLEGKAEATLDNSAGQLIQGQLALIPAMIPHNIRNIGQETLKVVGFFSSANVVSTFAEPLMPLNEKSVGTPPIETDEPLTWNDIYDRLME